MHAIDWAIVALYLCYMVWQGIRLSQGLDSAERFFLAGRALPWWAVGLSVMATQMSAITLIGTTGQAYADGMRFIQFYLGLPLAMILLCSTVVPFFHRARVFTAYEFLERRFDARTRTLTSFFFLVSRGLGAGVIIAAPAVVLSIVLGWDEVATIFTIGLTTTAYTMFGGVRAVTWTDVRQMVIILAGLFLCVLVILSLLPAGVGLFDSLQLAGAAGKLETIDFRFDLRERYTFWSGMFAAFFLFLSYFGCDQSQVQRYLTARSADEGRTSLLMSAFLKIPLQFLVLLIGVLVFVVYHFHTPPMIFNEAAAETASRTATREYAALESRFQQASQDRRSAAVALIEATDDAAASRYLQSRETFDAVRADALQLVATTEGQGSFTDVNYVFPSFILQHLPIGMVGLMIAAILAAAMSSVSAEINALATASTIDFYRRHLRPDASEAATVRFGRFATLLWGVFACIVATFATSLGSLIEVVNTFGSFFYGSLLGVFVLALGFERATASGAFFGLLIGMLSVWLASSGTDIAFLWFNVVGCLVTVGAGMAISYLQRRNTQ